jgi:hypothetical protein
MMQLVSEFEIQYLSPIHHAYPAWPGGERWLQLYQTDANTQIVITKGLSNGEEHLYEIYLETDEEISPEDFSNSWQANLVYEMGKIVPNVNDMSQRMEKNSYLSVQVDMDGAPPEWSLEDKNGNIGLFMGLQNPLIKDFANPSIPLNIKLMRPQELLYSIKNDYTGRLKLAELYLQQGNATISNLERESVL